MKKILFSFLFLLSIAVSSESFAQSANTCNGTLNCASITDTSKCTTALTGGTCAVSSGVCAVSGSATCSSPTSRSTCVAAPGCFWVAAGDANSNAFVNTMCNALKIVTGNGGKAFAAFAIISVGIGFFTGKISWGLMIGVTAGIAAMFGAPTIVAAIAGGSALDCGS